MWWPGCTTYCEPDMVWTWRVGAVPASTMSDIDQRSAWTEQAYKDAETALYHALGTHADYVAAMHKNIAATSQATKLRDMADGAFAPGVISPAAAPTPDQSLALQKYRNRAADLLTKLADKRKTLILDALKYQGLDLSAAAQAGQPSLGQGPPGLSTATPTPAPGGGFDRPPGSYTPPPVATDWGAVAQNAGVVALVSAAVYTGWRILTKGRI